MTKQPQIVFSERPVIILELPLTEKTRLLHPDQVMLKIGNCIHDIGAYCYALRSNQMRKPGKARKVVLDSFREERVDQIRQVIEVFSRFTTSGGKRMKTVDNISSRFKLFMDWADVNGCLDCLAGGDATRDAYQLYARCVDEKYRRHSFESANAHQLQASSMAVLQEFTGISDLSKGIRLIKDSSWKKGGTEPVSEHDFKHALTLNDCLFHGLCDLVLGNMPFPFKLSMPKSLGCQNDCLWVFPTNQWFLPPHQSSDALANLGKASGNYDYERGTLFSVNEIAHRHASSTSKKLSDALRSLRNTASSMEAANVDSQSYYRRLLAMAAHNAFYFLFLANTGANAAVVKTIEIDEAFEESTANPGYRTIKWRADGKTVSVIVPVAFVPTLRRFIELRKYLLNGMAFGYLFMSSGGGKRDSISQVSDGLLNSQYRMLQRIDCKLPAISQRQIRATVLNHYRQKHNPTISAYVGQHKEETAERSYNSGTEEDHHHEMSLVLEKIAERAKQKIVSESTILKLAKPLEDGGVCTSYGHPQPFGIDAPLTPNCKTGCLFCAKRVLIAGEGDTRKIASCAFLLTQLISGPLTAAEFQPQIDKCDEDLANIRAFEGCSDMVDQVKKDVFENGNLTPYFADKFQLFQAMGVL